MRNPLQQSTAFTSSIQGLAELVAPPHFPLLHLLHKHQRLTTPWPACHVVPADVDIENLPRRRTDNARILDRNKYTIKLYTSDGGTKLLRRPDGKVERQYRLNVGSLPVAYTSDKAAGADDSDLLYIMDRAVTSFQRDGKQLLKQCWGSGQCESAAAVLVCNAAGLYLSFWGTLETL